MARTAKLVTLALGLAALLLACTGMPPQPVRREMAVGDRQREWALVYYQSWRRDHQPDYLRLARSQMARAIRTYFRLQVRIGHSFPDFYDLDRKRRDSCQFLEEIDRMGFRFSVGFAEQEHEGCLKPE